MRSPASRSTERARSRTPATDSRRDGNVPPPPADDQAEERQDTHGRPAAPSRQTRNPDKWIRYGIDNPTQCQKQAFDAARRRRSYRGLVGLPPVRGVRAAGRRLGGRRRRRQRPAEGRQAGRITRPLGAAAPAVDDHRGGRGRAGAARLRRRRRSTTSRRCRPTSSSRPTAGTSSACCPAVRRTRASARAAAWSRSTRATATRPGSRPACSARTNVALGPNGKIFVSELFGGKISRHRPAARSARTSTRLRRSG